MSRPGPSTRPGSSLPRSRRRSRGAGESGVVAVEFMLVMSMFIVVFLLMLAFAVKAYAHRVAENAAEDGLASAASYRGSSAEGKSAAEHSLAGGGSASLHHTVVSVSRGTQTATVTVTGDAPQLLPFVPVRVTVTVRGPVERFVPQRGTP